MGYQPERTARTKTLTGGAPTLFPAENQKSIIRIYRYRKISRKEEYKIIFDLFSNEEKSFIAKHYAYIPAKEKSKIHRHMCYKARFNDDINYPIIEDLRPLKNCPV